MGAIKLQPQVREIPQFEMPDKYKEDIWKITDWDIYKIASDNIKKRWRVRSSITKYNFDYTLCNNVYIREELKYVMYFILNKGCNIGSLGEYYDRFKTLCRFIDTKNDLYTLLDCTTDEFKDYIILNEKNKTTIDNGNRILISSMEIIPSKKQSRIITFLSYSQKILTDYINRNEPLINLDIWDTDRIVKEFPTVVVKGDRQLHFEDIYQKSIKKAAKEFAIFKIHTLKIGTLSSYLNSIRRLSAWLNENHPKIKKISQLNRKTIRKFFCYLRTSEEYSNHIANKTILDLKVFFETVSLMDIDDKPSNVLITDQDYFFKQEKNGEFYTDIELQNMRNIIPKLNKTDGKILFCLMTLGVRVGEILELKTSSFIQKDDGSYYLNLGMDKVGREHIKPLNDEVACIIKSEIIKNKKRLGCEPEYVFYSDKGKPIRLCSLSRRINTALVKEKALDKDGKQLQFRSHKFRASFATSMLNAGYGEEATAKALGHNSIESLASYVHIHDETALKALAPRLEKDDILIRNIFDMEKKPKVVVSKEIATPLCNGFCVRNPEMGACPKANACLSCGLFKPSIEYLNYYCMQLNEVEATIQVAKANDMDLLLEKNLKLKSDLERIIKAVKEQINE